MVPATRSMLMKHSLVLVLVLAPDAHAEGLKPAWDLRRTVCHHAKPDLDPELEPRLKSTHVLSSEHVVPLMMHGRPASPATPHSTTA